MSIGLWSCGGEIFLIGEKEGKLWYKEYNGDTIWKGTRLH
jgi:hypothetical protein